MALTAAQKRMAAAKAKAKAKVAAARAKIVAAVDDQYKPADYVRGGKAEGNTYTAKEMYNGRTPNSVKGGPGEPYHEVSKKIGSLASRKANVNNAQTAARNAAIRKRKQSTSEKVLPTQKISDLPARVANPIGIHKALPPQIDARANAIRNRLSGVK